MDQSVHNSRALRQVWYAIAIPAGVAAFFIVSALVTPGDRAAGSAPAPIAVATASEPAFRYFPDQFVVKHWDERPAPVEYH